MTPSEDPLEAHGGISENNLNSILHIDDNLLDDAEKELNFNLTEYFDIDNFTEYSIRNENGINVFSLNTESICSKIELIKILITELKRKHNFTVHVASFQECWLNNESQISQLEIDNYQIFFELNKIGGQKGGLVTYVHESLTAKELCLLPESPTKLWQAQSIKITTDDLHKPLHIHNIYRLPREKSGKGALNKARENHENFLKEFEPQLDKIRKSPIESILVGDINYNLLEINSNSMVQEYFDIMINHEQIPRISVPTKINRESCKLYDHNHLYFIPIHTSTGFMCPSNRYIRPPPNHLEHQHIQARQKQKQIHRNKRKYQRKHGKNDHKAIITHANHPIQSGPKS